MTESCSGIRGSLSAIDWYVVPNTTVLPGTNNELSGEWFPQRNRIVVAGAMQHAGALIRHEMLHALLRETGHRRDEFLERCGGVVDCIETCIRDAGPPPSPPEGTPTVFPDALDVAVQIEPTAPGSATFGGYFTLTVTAHNPASHDVVVVLPPSGDSGPAFSFAFALDQHGSSTFGNYRAYDAEVTHLSARETRRQVFDFHVGSDPTNGGLPPGAYTANGSFGDSPAAPVAFTLSP
jgi:hypothetical protein